MFIEHNTSVEAATWIVIYNDEVHAFENEMEANDFYFNKKAKSDESDLIEIYQEATNE